MNKPFVGVALIGFFASFFIRFIALNQTLFANGWDTYFYLIQIQSLIDTGSMHSQEWTLLYPLLYVLSLLFEYVIAIKLLASLLAAFFTLSVLLIAYQHSESILAVVFVISLTLFSPELTYFAAQWPKNLLGIDLLLFMFLFLTKEHFKWALVFLVLGLFGHRLTAILGILLFSGWYLFSYFNAKIITLGFITIMTGLLIVNLLPGLFSIYDIQRLSNLFNTSLIISPLEFMHLLGSSKVPTYWQFELWVFYFQFILLGAYAIYTLINKKVNKGQFLLFLLLLLLWLPMYKFTLDGAAYRFFHTGALLALLIPVFSLKALLKTKHSNMGLMILSSVYIFFSFFSYKNYSPLRHDPPYKLYSNLTKKVKSQWEGNAKPELIIAHKSLAEYITFTTRIDAMPWLPEYKVEEGVLYRIGYFPLKQLAKFYLGNRLIFLKGNYGYLKETDWNYFLEQLKNNETEDVIEFHMDWKNPSRIRPSFLLKN